MARVEDIPQPTRDIILALECPEYSNTPWVEPKPLRDSRIAILTTAALHAHSDRPFEAGTADYRVLPSALRDMAMSHISINYDRSGFQQDINVAYPIDRLQELAAKGEIGSVADVHYSTMGSTDPTIMNETADAIVAQLKHDAVDTVLLCPV